MHEYVCNMRKPFRLTTCQYKWYIFAHEHRLLFALLLISADQYNVCVVLSKGFRGLVTHAIGSPNDNNGPTLKVAHTALVPSRCDPVLINGVLDSLHACVARSLTSEMEPREARGLWMTCILQHSALMKHKSVHVTFCPTRLLPFGPSQYRCSRIPAVAKKSK